MYKRLDDKYIKPCLLRENHFKDPKIIETYENLTERDALEFMKRNPAHFSELAGSKTMADLNALSDTKEDNNANMAMHDTLPDPNYPNNHRSVVNQSGTEKIVTPPA